MSSYYKLLLFFFFNSFLLTCKIANSDCDSLSNINSVIGGVLIIEDTTRISGIFELCSQRCGFGVNKPSYSINGYFYDGNCQNNGKNISVGKISVGNYSVRPNNENFYEINPIKINRFNISQMFNSILNIDISGNNQYNILPCNFSIYSPAELYVNAYSGTSKIESIGTNDNVELYWNPDKLNPLNNITILLSYNPGISQSLNSLNPKSIKSIVIKCVDNGYFKLDRNKLPQSDKLQSWTIYTIRYNSKLIYVNKLIYRFNFTSMCYQEFQISPQSAISLHLN